MSIGPRLPLQNAENCSCGGVYVFVRNTDKDAIWKCGQCDSQKKGPVVSSDGTTVWKSDEFTE